MLTNASKSENETIRAKDIVTPLLIVLAKAEQLNLGPLTSRQLEKAIQPIMTLSKEDMNRTPDRVSHFSRVVRNTVSSHKTLENQGMVRSFYFEGDPQVYVQITAKGRKELALIMLESMQYLPSIPELKKFSSASEVPINENAPRLSRIQLAEFSLLCLALLEKDVDGPVPINLLRRAVNALPGVQVRPEDARGLTRGYEVLLEYNMARRTSEGLKINARGVYYLLNNLLLNQLPEPPIPDAKPVFVKKKGFTP